MQAQPEATAQQSSAKPNIILILTDDQNEATLVHMPNVQRGLIDHGKVFENAVFTDPLCCPSRVTIHRGQYPHNTGIVQNAPPNGGWESFTRRGLHRSTMGTWLNDAGYRTAYFGKVMNGYSGKTIPGYDRHYAYSHEGMGWREISTGSRSFGVTPTNAEDLVAKEAASWLADASRSREPFFGVVSFGAPHAPYPHPSGLDERFRSVPLPDDPAINEANVSDKPPYVRRRGPLKRGPLTERYRDALRSLVNVDEFVGKALATVPPDTYVIFWTDNGSHDGYHRLPNGKRTPYEEDINFPLIIKGPGVSAGSSGKLVGNHDIAPTVADLAGVSVPRFVDGTSLRLLLGPTEPASWRDALLVSDARGTVGSGPWRGLRTERSMYVRYKKGSGERYDLESDPHELENSYTVAVPELESRMKAIGSCEGTSCWEAEGGTQDPAG
jgi:N-acetylglucosamine-6-sulfatase